ncbi:hypothetical protein LAZ67_3005579 [Cordylochernes scorpioides]|uniref:C2H2-type domain-containing protein n=1 Tax=Cordylochernes scorpioides TaxID=51811 RepID=A0ABY6KBU0_9ARAC|nr:hypothetical protein LAZ67_3005579 [Cordylochernes scorpioides]
METCKYCGKQLEYKSQLIDHEKTHTGEREFMCDWKGCDFRSHRKFNVVQHKVTHTEEKPFKCDHCNYRSAHKTHLRVHVRKHNDSKPYICDLCGFKTSYCNSLKDHKRNKHTDPALKCNMCKYVAYGEVDLKNHICEESLCCGECGYRSQSRSHLIRHQEVHNPVLYSCSLCRTRNPALKCKLCKYVARGKADLRSHSCDESHCCGECGYRTQSRSQFISHQEVHNTVLYSCSSVELGHQYNSEYESPQILYIVSKRPMRFLYTLLESHSKECLGYVVYVCTPPSFTVPHKKKSSGVRSGERAGNSIGPLRPIHWPDKFLSRMRSTLLALTSLSRAPYLDKNLLGQWIGRWGPIEFPARSPDLTPLDFFLWGTVKDGVYKRKPRNLDILWNEIQAVCREISLDVLIRCTEPVVTRTQNCIDAAGHQFEQY